MNHLKDIVYVLQFNILECLTVQYTQDYSPLTYILTTYNTIIKLVNYCNQHETAIVKY